MPETGRAWRVPSMILGILAFLLVVVEPIALALYASTIVGRMAERGVWAVVLLIVRVLIAGIGISAGRALWQRRAGSLAFAQLALLLAALGALATVLVPVLPTSRPPGTAVPLLVCLLIYYGGWIAYLGRLRRD